MAEQMHYKIAVMSDSHGNVGGIETELPRINECDMFVYLGDGNRDIDRLWHKITTKVVRVKGNCDVGCDLPDETVIQVGDTRFFITHGNAYGVKTSLLRLSLRAKELCCDYALYGHTHHALVTDAGGVTLVNPGTASRCGKKSFALIEGDGKSFVAKIVSMR